MLFTEATRLTELRFKWSEFLLGSTGAGCPRRLWFSSLQTFQMQLAVLLSPPAGDSALAEALDNKALDLQRSLPNLTIL